MIASSAYTLKMLCGQQEVALNDATLCNKCELENNAQINTKFNPCMNRK